jgi:hypothetical protein
LNIVNIIVRRVHVFQKYIHVGAEIDIFNNIFFYAHAPRHEINKKMYKSNKQKRRGIYIDSPQFRHTKKILYYIIEALRNT